jgi:Fanconi anemia group M protein
LGCISKRKKDEGDFIQHERKQKIGETKKFAGLVKMIETQKIFGLKDKVVIISDYREREVAKILENLGAKVNTMNLSIGDFVLSEKVCVERKTHSDFVSSIIDGRIFEQAKNLKENFEKPIMIIEGFSNREINENALKGALASLLIDFGISIINTLNTLDTAKTIYWLAKKEQREKKECIAFKVGKKPVEIKKLQEKIVSSLPGVSNVISKRLLEEFCTIEKIFTAKENELQKVKGIGKKLAKKIRKILTEKYR